MSELWHSFLETRGRIVEKWAHYFPIYERHFKRFQDTACTVVEIGCGQGGSLQMWKRYFGPNATIVGLDINAKCKELTEPQIEIRIGNQSDNAFLLSVLGEFGSPDIVIDDGSHQQEDVLASFGILYPCLATRGVYLVEDLHAAYWQEFGGREGRNGAAYTFIEKVKDLIDALHLHHQRGDFVPSVHRPLESAEFAASTDSIHVYDSMVILERSPRSPPRKVVSGCFGEWRGMNVPPPSGK